MYTLALDDHPGMKSVHHGCGLFLTYSPSGVRLQVVNFAFNLI
jgi:hypothetical protein